MSLAAMRPIPHAAYPMPGSLSALRGGKGEFAFPAVLTRFPAGGATSGPSAPVRRGKSNARPIPVDPGIARDAKNRTPRDGEGGGGIVVFNSNIYIDLSIKFTILVLYLLLLYRIFITYKDSNTLIKEELIDNDIKNNDSKYNNNKE